MSERTGRVNGRGGLALLVSARTLSPCASPCASLSSSRPCLSLCPARIRRARKRPSPIPPGARLHPRPSSFSLSAHPKPPCSFAFVFVRFPSFSFVFVRFSFVFVRFRCHRAGDAQHVRRAHLRQPHAAGLDGALSAHAPFHSLAHPSARLTRVRPQGSDMATALARLNSGLDSVNRQIRLQVEGNYAGLIGQIEHVDSLEGPNPAPGAGRDARWEPITLERGRTLHVPLDRQPHGRARRPGHAPPRTEPVRVRSATAPRASS